MIPSSRRFIWAGAGVLACMTAIGANAEVYRFPVFADEVRLERPRPGLRQFPRTVRVLSPALGSYFHSVAVEFEVADDGGLKRSKTYAIDYLQDALKVPRQTFCGHLLANRQEAMGQALVDTIVAGTSQRRVGGQALAEMTARNYLGPEEMREQVDATEGTHPDHFIFFESLSWMTANEALSIFRGIIPWPRIAEIEAPGGFSNLEDLKARTEAGSDTIRVRVRRATLRLALGTAFTRYGIMSQVRLPFEIGMEKKGRRGRIPIRDDAGFRFEFGRASQIPGLDQEALQLTGVAAAVAAYYVSLVGRPGEYPDLNSDIAYFHSLAPDRTHLFKQTLDLSIIPGLDQPNDTLLVTTLKRLVDKTFPLSGLFRDLIETTPRELQPLDPFVTIKTQREGISHRYHTFNWRLNGRDMTVLGPLLIQLSPANVRKISEMRIRASARPDVLSRWADTLATRPPQQILSPMHVLHDKSHQFIPPDWQNRFDVILSGLSPNLLNDDPNYLLMALLTFTRYVNLEPLGSDPSLLVVCADRAFVDQIRSLGLTRLDFTDQHHRVRYALKITWNGLLELRRAHPERWSEAESNSLWNEHPVRTFFSLVNLDGFE